MAKLQPLNHPTSGAAPSTKQLVDIPRSNKMLKTAYDRNKQPDNSSTGTLQQQPFPVKITDLNQMVQIRRKRPKLKYQDKLIHKA